jgi:methionine-rich copper-binding protein CopC
MDARREIDVTRFRWEVGFGRVCRGMGVLATMAIAGPAAAHSELRGSIPATGAVLDCAPEAISLQFSEQVQLTALRLYRVDGDEVDLPRRVIRETREEIIALPPLEPGEFRAEWRIISGDGHPVGGVIAFTVAGDCAP